jgi:hypothetical protein
MLKTCYKVGQSDPVMGSGRTDLDVRVGIVGHKNGDFSRTGRKDGKGKRQGKGKVYPRTGPKAQRVSRCIALLFP